MQTVNQIYLWLFCVLLFIIPFTEIIEAVPNLIIIVLALLFPFVIKKDLKSIIVNKELLWLLGFCLIIIIEALFYDRLEDIKFISKLFLLFTYLILSQPLVIKNNMNKVFYSFLFGVLCVLVSSITLIIKEHSNANDFDFSVGKKINSLLLGDRPYIGFCYTIAFFVGLYLSKYSKKKVEKRLMIAFSGILLIFLYYISARTSLLSILIVGFISIFFFVNKKVKLGALVITLLLGISIIFFNKNFKERLTSGFKQQNFSLEKSIKLEPRYHIWGCVKFIMENNSVTYFGYGFLQTQEMLNSCYQNNYKFLNQSHKKWVVYKSYNTHNQYLNFYLSTGLLGFLYFVLICCLFSFKYKSNFFSLSLIISMLLFFTFENVLTRQMGVQLCAIVVIFSNGLNTLRNDCNKQVL